MKLPVILTTVSLVVFGWAEQAAAQNTGGVFPPGFGDDHKSAQYRAAIDTDTDLFAQRLHYQQSIDAHRTWRILGGTRETDSSDFDFDFVGAELFWEFTETDDKWRKGIRFDAIYRDDDRPSQFNFNFMNQWNFDDGWSARLINLSTLQIGNNRSDGIAFQPRAQINKKLESGPSIGVEYFGSLGSTERLSFKDNRQTIGPYVSFNIVDKTSLMLGTQFGLNDASSNADLRLWVTQGF